MSRIQVISNTRRSKISAKKPKIKAEDLVKRYRDLLEIARSWMGGHPRNIIMLTYDAFGVLPPVAKLTPEQAMYHFLTGYTAKVAGTEREMGGKPEALLTPASALPSWPFLQRSMQDC